MASYVNNSEKAENNRSSAYTLLIVGSIGFILVVLYFLDVIPVRGLNKYMTVSYTHLDVYKRQMETLP